MPLPLLGLLGIGVLAWAASQAGSSRQASGTPPTPAASPVGPPGEPGGDSEGESSASSDPPRERSSQYNAFLSAYAATPYHNAIVAAEQENDLPENLLARTLYAESSFRPDVVSATGDVGIAQFAPATANDLGIDPANPDQAIPKAAEYLRGLRDTLGDWYSALVAYNWGIGKVQSYGANAAPAATKNYANNILADTELA